MFHQPLETGAPDKLKTPYRSGEREGNKRSEFRFCPNNWCPSTAESGSLTPGLEWTVSKQSTSVRHCSAFPIRHSMRLSSRVVALFSVQGWVTVPRESCSALGCSKHRFFQVQPLSPLPVPRPGAWSPCRQQCLVMFQLIQTWKELGWVNSGYEQIYHKEKTYKLSCIFWAKVSFLPLCIKTIVYTKFTVFYI